MNSHSDAEQRDAVASLQERIRELEQAAERSNRLLARLEARDAVTRIVAESPSLADAAPRILRSICELLGWQAGAFWLPEKGLSVLRCLETWSAGESPNFESDSQRRRYPMGVGLPGRVWLTKEPAWIPNVDLDDNFARIAAASRDGLHTAFGIPIIVENEVAGILEFFSKESRPPDESLLQMFVIAGHQIGIFMERRRAEEQLVRQARVSALRADVAAALGRSGDIRMILGQCTDAVVQDVGAAFARIWTLNALQNVLELQASSGLYTHIDGGHSRIPVGSFKIGWIAEKRQPHLTNSVPDDPRVTNQDWARREGMQAFAGYPLLVEGRLAGVLAMFARQALEPLILDELAPIADAMAQFLERRRAQEELKTSEALKTAILETSLDAIVAINEAGRVIEFNASAESMFGYRRATVLGRPIADLIVPPRFREAHRAGLARYLSTGEARVLGRRIQIEALRSDGTEFPIELAISRIRGDGPPIFTAYIRQI